MHLFLQSSVRFISFLQYQNAFVTASRNFNFNDSFFFLSLINKTDKTRLLQNCLRQTYEILYNAVRPIPYVREKLYCVNEVFVECGIVADDRRNLAAESKDENYFVLESYANIFDDSVLPAKRIVVEGDPGYGKSTIALHAAFDWCTTKSTSTLNKVDIFIFLSMRLLGSVFSIYHAIKQLLLPRECNLTETDICDIINSCASVVIVLDGFDEYPDKQSHEESDFIKIISGKMFPSHRTVLFTRSFCLPSNLDPRTIRVRLTGFDERARSNYILKIVTGDYEVFQRIKHVMEKNPIISDLCQVPLFFVMLTHMALKGDDVSNGHSVTSFVKFTLSCFYSHMWDKLREAGSSKECFKVSNDHSRLHKIAFKGLTTESKINWAKDEFLRKVGSSSYEELITIGILIEESLLEVTDDPNTPVAEYIRYRKVVRFCHKIFAEWYAAHYVAENASRIHTIGLSKILKNLDPMELQFVFRFACGLNPTASRRIIKYLQSIEGGDSFATLCILEKTGSTDDIIETVREMCQKTIIFSYRNSRLLQRSNVQLIKLASEKEILIPTVVLHYCFSSVDTEKQSLCLNSGIDIPCLNNVRELVILELYSKDQVYKEAQNILHYAARCAKLNLIR
ncbi:NACHT, LRR and PYD domains-containing protein 10 [Holothuria leucospilota]|uniref:NACHT, LRR and PYD domains-containing protein 10 n=1 Tax=Holothuria leucospilota TaxID=206669 RepID=A0A9Q1HKK3_HOLLE|nr:NACHT, LRR and PYD domains-containing protein 10 [Holothuria leucospilota]